MFKLQKDLELTYDEIEFKNNDFRSMVSKRMASKNYAFFRLMMFNFRWQVTFNTPEGALAYVQYDPYNLGEIVGGTIYIGHELFRDSRFGFNHYAFVLMHEILHIINGHGYRRGNRNPLIWNLAADHTINTFLKDFYEETEKSKQTPIMPFGGFEACYICEELENKKARLTTEEVYDYILREMKDRYQIEQLGDGDGDSGGKDGEEQKDGQGQKDGKSPNFYKVTDKKTGKSWVISDAKASPEDIKRERQYQAEARATYELQKQRGLLPGFMQEYLSRILKVEIPWTELLKRAIKQNVIMKPNSRGWKQLHKNYIAHGLSLPGLQYEEENTGVGICIVVVDTSGSISNEDLAEFAGIIYESIHQFKEIILITHDVDVHQEMVFDADTAEAFLAMLKSEGFKGRGGTSHDPVFQRIQKLYDEKDEPISMVLSLTDACSDIEEVWDKYEWSRKDKIPTYFIITKDGRYLDKFRRGKNEEEDQNINPGQIKINSVDQ